MVLLRRGVIGISLRGGTARTAVTTTAVTTTAVTTAAAAVGSLPVAAAFPATFVAIAATVKDAVASKPIANSR